jgi:hypothetical protein
MRMEKDRVDHTCSVTPSLSGISEGHHPLQHLSGPAPSQAFASSLSFFLVCLLFSPLLRLDWLPNMTALAHATTVWPQPRRLDSLFLTKHTRLFSNVAYLWVGLPHLIRAGPFVVKLGLASCACRYRCNCRKYGYQTALCIGDHVPM